jgi:hypothetical protein
MLCVRCVDPCLGFPTSGNVPRISGTPDVDASRAARTQKGMAQDGGLPCACLPKEGNALPTVALLQVPYVSLGRTGTSSLSRTKSDSMAVERGASPEGRRTGEDLQSDSESVPSEQTAPTESLTRNDPALDPNWRSGTASGAVTPGASLRPAQVHKPYKWIRSVVGPL